MSREAKWPKTQIVFFLVFLLGMGFLLRILIGMVYLNYFDLAPYNIPWALGARENRFQMYTLLDNLDYPPLFPFLLSFLGDGIAYAEEHGIWQLTMLLVKLIPILFDTALILFLYLAAGRRHRLLGLIAAAVWASNPSAIINSAFWGQTDSILLFWVGMTFFFLQNERTTAASLCFAAGCLSKLQMAYFAPILLCELFFYYPVRKAFRSLFAGIFLGVGGWLPFMIGSRNLFLPFQIYFGGFGKYSYVNVNADNLYGLFPLNWVLDNTKIAGKITYAQLNAVIFSAILVLLLLEYWFSAKRGKRVPPALTGLLFYNAIFMFTTKMHERYQLPAVMLAMLFFLLRRNSMSLFVLSGLILTTFLNQTTLLLQANFGGLFETVRLIAQPVTSFINLLLCFCMTSQYLDYVRERKGLLSPVNPSLHRSW